MEPRVEINFGIPFLAELVRARMEKGRSLDVAIESVGRACELRSEAIQKLRAYMTADSAGEANER